MYLGARYYDSNTGRFNRLDPWAGNSQDPQSLHKYLYTHGDPVQGIDPTGLFSVIGVSSANSIGAVLNQMTVQVGQSVIDTFDTGGSIDVIDTLASALWSRLPEALRSGITSFFNSIPWGKLGYAVAIGAGATGLGTAFGHYNARLARQLGGIVGQAQSAGIRRRASLIAATFADEATGLGLRYREALGAARLEMAIGGVVRESNDAAADFIHSKLKRVSLKGPLLDDVTRMLRLGNAEIAGLLKASQKGLANSGADALVVDLAGLSSKQVSSFRRALDGSPNPASLKIVYLTGGGT